MSFSVDTRAWGSRFTSRSTRLLGECPPDSKSIGVPASASTSFRVFGIVFLLIIRARDVEARSPWHACAGLLTLRGVRLPPHKQPCPTMAASNGLSNSVRDAGSSIAAYFLLGAGYYS